jgi:hypothetical protein
MFFASGCTSMGPRKTPPALSGSGQQGDNGGRPTNAEVLPGLSPGGRQDAMIMRNAWLVIDVRGFDEVEATVASIAEKGSGYIESSVTAPYLGLVLTLRVPINSYADVSSILYNIIFRIIGHVA